MDNSVLIHYGVLGMKWGVRRFQNKDGSLTSAGKKHYGGDSKEKKEMDPERRERLKKVAIATGTVITVAAATALYLNNKSAVDNFVKQHGKQLLSTVQNKAESGISAASHKVKSQIVAEKMRSEINRSIRIHDDRAYAKAHKSEILKSASKLNRYKDYLPAEDVKKAVDNLKQTRELHQLSQAHIKRGADYVSAFLAYGAAASTAYGLLKSPMVQDTKKKTTSSGSKKSTG